jgi:tetratricopeptide (TPR) repeat protein
MCKSLLSISFLFFYNIAVAQPISKKNDTLQIKELHQQAFEAVDSIAAFTLQKKARILSENLANRKWLVENRIVEAALYHLFNDEKKAIAINEIAESLCIKYNYNNKLAVVVSNTGIYYSTLGDTKKAIANFYRALTLAETNKDELLAAKCYEYIASDSYDGVQKTESDFKIAVEFITKAISIYQKKEKWPRMASAYNNLGLVYQYHGDIEEAFNSYKKVIAIATNQKSDFKESQEITISAFAQGNLAFLQLNKHERFDLVEAYARSAIPTLLKYDEKQLLTKCYLYIGLVGIYTQNLNKAKIYLDSSKSIAKEIGDTEAIMLNWEAQYKLDSAQGNVNASLKSYQRYTSLKDSLYSVENMAAIKKMNLQFETEKKDIKIEQQNQKLTQQKWMIALVSLLGLMALVIGFFIYRSKKLNQHLFAQKEKALLLEKDNALIAKKLEETARKKAEIENQVAQDEKEKAQLREKLKGEENLRLQNDIEFKHKELATITLNIQQKNSLLEELRGHLSELSEKKDTDQEDAIRNMRRSIKNNINFDEDWDKVKIHFENVHTDFFEKLSAISPNLTPNELKQCAYIKINMNPKEVGNLLGIDAQSVRMSRYRIKKKLLLGEEVDLADFILKL